MPLEDLMNSLNMGPQMAPQTTAQSIGGMLQGLGAGFQGQPDPRIGQMQMAQNAYDSQVRQKIALAGLQERVDARRDRQTAMQTEILQQMAEHSDVPGKKYAWEQIAKLNKIPMPPQVLEGLTSGALDQKAMNRMAAQASGNWTDEEIMKFNPGTTLEQVQAVRKYSASDAGRKALKLETEPERDKRLLDEELKRTRIMLEEARTQLANRKQDESEARVAQGERRLTQGDKRLELMEKSIETRIAQMNKNALTKETRRTETMTVMEDAINMMETYSAALDAKGFLPKGSDILSGAKASTNRKLFYNDSDLKAWHQLQASLIGFDRSVLNDIGARAFAAFKNQYALFDNPPTKEAIDKVIGNMRRLLQDARTGKIPDMETVIIQLPNGKKMRATDYRRGDPLPPGAQIVGTE